MNQQAGIVAARAIGAVGGASIIQQQQQQMQQMMMQQHLPQLMRSESAPAMGMMQPTLMQPAVTTPAMGSTPAVGSTSAMGSAPPPTATTTATVIPMSSFPPLSRSRTSLTAAQMQIQMQMQMQTRMHGAARGSITPVMGSLAISDSPTSDMLTKREFSPLALETGRTNTNQSAENSLSNSSGSYVSLLPSALPHFTNQLHPNPSISNSTSTSPSHPFQNVSFLPSSQPDDQHDSSRSSPSMSSTNTSVSDPNPAYSSSTSSSSSTAFPLSLSFSQTSRSPTPTPDSTPAMSNVIIEREEEGITGAGWNISNDSQQIAPAISEPSYIEQNHSLLFAGSPLRSAMLSHPALAQSSLIGDNTSSNAAHNFQNSSLFQFNLSAAPSTNASAVNSRRNSITAFLKLESHANEEKQSELNLSQSNLDQQLRSRRSSVKGESAFSGLEFGGMEGIGMGLIESELQHQQSEHPIRLHMDMDL